MRSAQSAEQDSQHGAGVGGGAHGGARVGSHPLLVHDDRGGQPLQYVDIGARHAGHEPLDERAVRLVDQALGLSGDGVEHQ
jgi:hypothetical protein